MASREASQERLSNLCQHTPPCDGDHIQVSRKFSMMAALFPSSTLKCPCFRGRSVMAKAVFPRGLRDKPQQEHRLEDRVRLLGVMLCHPVVPAPLRFYAFHRYSHLVQARAVDYSLSPKISAVSRRKPHSRPWWESW